MKLKVTALIRMQKPEFAKILVAPAPHITAKYVIQSTRISHFEDTRYLIAEYTVDSATSKRFFTSFTHFADANENESAVITRFNEQFGDVVNDQDANFNLHFTAASPSSTRTASTSASTTKAIEFEPVVVSTPWQADFYVPEDEMNAFSAALALAKATNHPTKILIIGASGYGKTSLPKAFAMRNEMQYARFNTALVRDPEEFFGFRTVVDGNIEFVDSPFTRAIKQGNTVVVLDELNRAAPEMANAIFPILDDDAKTEVFGNVIEVGPNTLIVATVNIGYQFVGTFALDQALVNRMDITLRVGPLPTDREVEVLTRRTGCKVGDARTIVSVCDRLRWLTSQGTIDVDASTRTSIKVAKFVAGGISISDAFMWVVINGASEDDRKEVIDAVSEKLI